MFPGSFCLCACPTASKPCSQGVYMTWETALNGFKVELMTVQS